MHVNDDERTRFLVRYRTFACSIAVRTAARAAIGTTTSREHVKSPSYGRRAFPAAIREFHRRSLSCTARASCVFFIVETSWRRGWSWTCRRGKCARRLPDRLCSCVSVIACTAKRTSRPHPWLLAVVYTCLGSEDVCFLSSTSQ